MRRDRAHKRLMAKANQYPGVADVVRIFDQFAKVDVTHKTYLGAINPPEILYSTDSVSHR